MLTLILSAYVLWVVASIARALRHQKRPRNTPRIPENRNTSNKEII